MINPVAGVVVFAFLSPLNTHAETGAGHTHDHSAMGHQDMPMTGFMGNYPMSREASGTSWQPESSPHRHFGFMAGDWMVMTHGFVDLIYDKQGGPRGDSKIFTQSMLMAMGSRRAGPGTLGLRAMLSGDPTMGSNGYPLIFQNGETADGKTGLVDRQHPHDFFMELSATYSIPVSEESSAFAYFGLPGEPALGPPVFMHRLSGEDNPEAPIGHHWMDSTHITQGVGTIGYIWKEFKLDASVFRGREPDHRRWDIEKPEFDSYSGPLTYNPTRNWSLQASMGSIHSPEALEANVNLTRGTVSAMHNVVTPLGLLQTTLAWGENNVSNHRRLDDYLVEGALRIHEVHTFFSRVERVEKNELFEETDPLGGRTFTINKGTLGYVYDFPKYEHVQPGVGALGSVFVKPSDLNAAYGRNLFSFMIWLRAKFL